MTINAKKLLQYANFDIIKTNHISDLNGSFHDAEINHIENAFNYTPF